MKTTILSAKKLCKSFTQNGVENPVLKNVDVEIYKGDFTVIMGTSGSGKSTLLYCLSRMDSVTDGEVIYNSESISRFSEKKMAKLRSTNFGFVFQQMHLISSMTLLENILISGYLNKKAGAESIKDRANKLLKEMKIDAQKHRLPSQVSGGEAQRAAIARALINEPELVFADEPTGALNRNNTENILDIFCKINQQGQSVLIVTHDPHVAIRANRVIYLEDGKIRGEINLPVYKEDDYNSREQKINEWLHSMEW